MSSSPADYFKRAMEMEEAASKIREPLIKASFLDLAQAFREMGLFADRQPSDAEIESLAERMLGRRPH